MPAVMMGDSGSPQFISGRAVSLTSDDDSISDWTFRKSWTSWRRLLNNVLKKSADPALHQRIDRRFHNRGQQRCTDQAANHGKGQGVIGVRTGPQPGATGDRAIAAIS